MRLDLALIARHPALSRRQARAAIEKGQVTVDGVTVVEPGRRLETSAEVVWHPHRRARPRRILDPFVLHHDDHVIVIDKPAGLLSVPTSGGRNTEDTALARVESLLRRVPGRRPYVGRVHRLDRDTSGALAFALSPEARAGLIETFRLHAIERVYLALVCGRPRDLQGVIDAPIRSVYSRGRRGIGNRARRRARTFGLASSSGPPPCSRRVPRPGVSTRSEPTSRTSGSRCSGIASTAHRRVCPRRSRHRARCCTLGG